MGSQRAGHDWVAEQQINVRMKLDPKTTPPHQINLSQINDLNEDQKP